MNLEQEIRELKQRVTKAEAAISQLEGSFEFVSGQLKDIHNYMIGEFDSVRTEIVNLRVDMNGEFGRVHSKIEGVRAEVRSLRDELPGIVSGAVREGFNTPPF